MRRAWVLLLMAMAACQGSAGPASGPPTTARSAVPAPAAQTTAPAAAPTIAATTPPSPLSGVQSICVDAYLGSACTLRPATYRPTGFKPPLTFTLTEEYTADGAHDTGFGISQDDFELILTIGMIEGFDLETAFQLDDHGKKLVKLAPGAKGFLAYLREHPMLTVSEPVPATILGIAAMQVDVRSKAPKLMSLHTTSVFGFDIEPTAKARFIVTDVEGKAFVVLVNATDASDFDSAWPKAKAVIDSMSFVK